MEQQQEERGRLRSAASIGTRAFGVVVLAGLLLAACGDDDDDVDLQDAATPTAVAATATPAESAGGDVTATVAVDDDDDATQDDVTSDDAATPTEDAQGATPTEDMTRATGTEDAAGSTGTEDTTGATSTESGGPAATGTSGRGDDNWRGREARVGEMIRIDDDVVVTVERVEEVMGIPGVVEPGDGNRFIAIELTVENLDDDPITAIELFNAMRVVTHDGSQWFRIDPLVTASLLQDRDVFDQDIGEGQSVTGNVAFEFPADTNDLYLVLNDDDDDDWDEDWDDDDDDDLVRVDLSEELSR